MAFGAIIVTRVSGFRAQGLGRAFMMAFVRAYSGMFVVFFGGGGVGRGVPKPELHPSL